MVKEDITKLQQLLCKQWSTLRLDPFCPGHRFGPGENFPSLPLDLSCASGTNLLRGALQMEMEISEKVQRLTRILSEEANKFPRVTVDPYSTGTYGYDWKVYLDRERQLGTIAFTTDVTLSEKELRAAFRHELKALVRNQVASPVPALTAGPR
jgi:hypothetical protein